MNDTHIKLRERVKELNCLYSISRAAWETKNDLDSIIRKTLAVLPGAMQFPSLAEADVTVNRQPVSTPKFKTCISVIRAPITVDGKNYGAVSVGYRPAKLNDPKRTFLAEEKNLLKAVARELSQVIKRSAIEEDKQKLQVQLQHAERLAFVGELSAGIAHELNEPLGRILGFAQLIKKSGKLNDQQEEDIERIIKASLYTREIIKKLMIFARQMPQQIAKVDINAVVDNILYFIDVRFQSRGIEITKHLDKSLPLLHCDEVQIGQVLVNLITNAIHAMPSGGMIRVETKLKKEYASLSVRDTGTGMTPEVRAKIFEPFFTTKPVGQGTGLGLSVVQGIIESHNGKIAVTTAPGKGTRFEVLLPLGRRKKS